MALTGRVGRAACVPLAGNELLRYGVPPPPGLRRKPE